MDEPEEAALVRRCQAGDAEAFRILVEAYRNTLFGVAFLMTHDRPAAEDAVQGGLVQVWRCLPSLRGPSKVKPWLIRIVVNEVKQQFRMKHVPVAPLEAAADIPDETDLPEQKVISAERRQTIRRALSKLPPEQREAVVLRYYSGLTVPEIGGTTGQPQGTVKSRLHRDLAHLGKELGYEGLR
ncbi:RNA polymerase sigma factor, sigma-70 family [Dehalogenimonas alkenigignens]|uniref:RNA polymerase sigma factor, sigma-70 family n=1 Tax=Dehalogenimonas alkenigignens TaxID=1217799 RepID=A0A0W0GGW9_9CHLR|nr:RNA polymerase sigma factor [Dehalogenimonas alkenigignens]KTB47794.1 RNA polymerase sigma factor, sigma-70 family [Dehalogenimonas alkenigignens]